MLKVSLASLSVLAAIAIPVLGNAGTLSGVREVTLVSGSGGFTANQCYAVSDPQLPQVNSSVESTYTLKAVYVANSQTDLPPSTITVSYKDQLNASLNYQLVGSSPSKGWSVSAKYYCQLSILGIPFVVLTDDTGTVSQGQYIKEDFRDESNTILVNGRQMTPDWGSLTYDSSTGKYVYTAIVDSWTLSGTANTTALGWTPPYTPPGTQPAIPSGFQSEADWNEGLNYLYVNSSSSGGGGTSPGGGTPPGGGSGSGGL